MESGSRSTGYKVEAGGTEYRVTSCRKGPGDERVAGAVRFPRADETYDWWKRAIHEAVGRATLCLRTELGSTSCRRSSPMPERADDRCQWRFIYTFGEE